MDYFNYKIITKSTAIRMLIVDIINEENYIAFALSGDKLALSFNDQNFVLMFDKDTESDILLLTNSQNINKIVLSLDMTLLMVKKKFGILSCNQFIDIVDLAKSEDKNNIYQKMEKRLRKEINKTRDEFKTLALETFYLLQAYEQLNIKRADNPSFDAFCLFSYLNIVNSELSKRNKVNSKELKEKILEEEFKYSLEGIKLPCEFDDEIYHFLSDNKLIVKKDNTIKLTKVYD